MDSDPARLPASTAGTILFVLPWSPDAIGGVSEVVVNLWRVFARSTTLQPRLLTEAYPHRTITTIATGALGPIDGIYLMPPTAPGKRLRHGVAFLLRLLPALARLGAYLRRHNVRAINIHCPSLCSLTLLLARPRRIPVVLSFHGSDLNAARNTGGIDRWLWDTMIGRSDALVACSNAFAKELRDTFPAARGKLHVILNGVDGEACRAAARSASLPAPLQGRRYLVNIGTFERKKGQDVLLAAFDRIAGAHPDLCLALVGRSGPTLPAVQKAADRLRGRVHIFADQSHKSAMAILSHAALMLHPARQEPFGLVLLEAAVLDVPVIATKVGGIPEIIEDGRSGRLVPADDPDALAAAALEALADAGKTRLHAAALRQAAEDRFPWTRAAEAYATLFRTPLAPRAPGGEPRSAR